MPVPPNALIEGYPNPDDGERHVLVLDRNGCWLYELYRGFRGHGAWKADSTAVWDMTINEQRPYTWTSADAAGLPIFPGLVRIDEVLAGAINQLPEREKIVVTLYYFEGLTLAEIGEIEVGIGYVRLSEFRPTKVRTHKIRLGKSGTAEIGVGKDSAIQFCLCEIGTDESCLGQVGARQLGLHQNCSG